MSTRCIIHGEKSSGRGSALGIADDWAQKSLGDNRGFLEKMLCQLDGAGFGHFASLDRLDGDPHTLDLAAR